MFPVQLGVQMKNRSSHCAHNADRPYFWRITGNPEVMLPLSAVPLDNFRIADHSSRIAPQTAGRSLLFAFFFRALEPGARDFGKVEGSETLGVNGREIQR